MARQDEDGSPAPTNGGTPTITASMKVTVVVPGSTIDALDIADIYAHRCALHFSHADAAKLSVGRLVRLRLACEGHDQLLEVPSQITERSEPSEDRSLLHFAFLTASVDPEVRAILSRLLSRSGQLRIEPRHPDEVTMGLLAPAKADPLPVVILDLSEGGARVRVPLQAEISLAASPAVRVALRFRGDDAELSLPGRILRRECDGDRITYAVRFDETQEEDGRKAVERIRAWVDARSREPVAR